MLFRSERAAEIAGCELSLRDKTSKKKRSIKAAARTEGEKGGGELSFEDLAGYAAILRTEGCTSGAEGDAGSATEESKSCTEGVMHGTVADFIDDPMNPLLNIDSDGREILIPALGNFISDVDTDTRTVTFILPEGFLELYL